MKANLLILLGSISLLFCAYQVDARLAVLPIAPAVAAAESLKSPVRLLIPSLNLDLPIYSSQLVNGKWETNSKGISYWQDSPLPGSVGNSVMYGHNWPNILGSLHLLKPGDHLQIFDKSGGRLDYIVTLTSTVPGSQTDILNATSDSRLTLYTCIGLFDKDRFVVRAEILH